MDVFNFLAYHHIFALILPKLQICVCSLYIYIDVHLARFESSNCDSNSVVDLTQYRHRHVALILHEQGVLVQHLLPERVDLVRGEDGPPDLPLEDHLVQLHLLGQAEGSLHSYSNTFVGFVQQMESVVFNTSAENI